MTAPARSLRRAVDVVIPMVLLFALHLLLVGHEEPGGGFVAGLLAAGALAIDALATDAVTRAHPAEREGRGLVSKARFVPSGPALIAGGLTVAAAVALIPVLSGNAPLDHAGITIDLGVFGVAKLTSVLVFDLGVFAIVLGFAGTVLDRVREVLS